MGNVRRLPVPLLAGRCARASNRSANWCSKPITAAAARWCTRAGRVPSPRCPSCSAARRLSRSTTSTSSSPSSTTCSKRLVRATPHHGVEAALVELDRRQIAKWGPRYHDEHGKYDAAWTELDEPLAPTYLEWRFGPPRSDESRLRRPALDGRAVSCSTSATKRFASPAGSTASTSASPPAGNVFNVIDYKSGKRPSLSTEKIESGERLQPALYVMAAQALLVRRRPAHARSGPATGRWRRRHDVDAALFAPMFERRQTAERTSGNRSAAKSSSRSASFVARHPRRQFPRLQPRRPLHQPLRLPHRLPHRPSSQPRQAVVRRRRRTSNRDSNP